MILTRTDLHRWFRRGFQPWANFYSFQLHSNLNTHFFFEQQVPMISQPFLGLPFGSLRLLSPRSGASHYLLNLLSLIFKPEKTAHIWRRHRCMVSPRNAVWGTSTEIPHRWRVILSWAGQCFWLVENLLQPIKKGHYPDLDGNVSYGFCPPSSDVILRENRRCNREMPAVFSSLICFLSLLCLY